jgi:hypothetical protein
VAEGRLALQHVNRGLVALVIMGLGFGARRHDQKVHADSLGAGAFGGYAREVVEALLAVIAAGPTAAANDLARLHPPPLLEPCEATATARNSSARRVPTTLVELYPAPLD